MSTILLIEDEMNIRLFVAANLEARGYRVLEAETGAQGLDTLRTAAPDVLILDMALPDMTGLDVLAQMAAAPALSTIPTILMTASASMGGSQRFTNVTDRLVKPSSITLVLDAVKRAEKKRVMSDEE
jgi:CheY-like chemotaxis protein